MKVLIGFVVMFMASDAWAGEWLPTVEHMVKPHYPKELRRTHMGGEVRLKVLVNADGSVVDPKIVYSTHPFYAGAALKVIGEWRFASRPSTGENPLQLEVFVPFIFEFEPVAQANKSAATLDLATATCQQLNHDVDKYVLGERHMPLANLQLFWLVQQHLVDGFIADKYNNEALAVGLFDLSEGMIKVAKTCQRRITRRFVDLMPPSVKTLLATGGMEIKSE